MLSLRQLDILTYIQRLHGSSNSSTRMTQSCQCGVVIGLFLVELFFLLPISFLNNFPSFSFLHLSFFFLCCIKKSYIYIYFYFFCSYFIHIYIYKTLSSNHFLIQVKIHITKKINNCGSIIMETNIFYAILYHFFFSFFFFLHIFLIFFPTSCF